MYIGIDLGTSGVRALLIDEDQRPVGSADAPLSVARPHPGWAEQNPAAWISAVESVLDALARDHKAALSAVAGIGLSGQMHGAALLGPDDRVLRPCILWNDSRSHEEAAALDADVRFRSISGNIVFPGFTAPKLLWLRAHEPDCFARVATVLLPKDFVRLWLTGERVTDMSDASGTGWLDTAGRRWSEALLCACGMALEQTPRLVEGSAPSGALRRELSARWGMRPGVTVAGGAGDNAASAIGMGVVEPGAAFVSLGTSGVLFAADDRFRPEPETAVHAFCHALPATWHQMGVILSAASALSWFADLVGESPDALTRALGETLAAPGETIFLPYLSGERTPHNDARIRGAFAGLGHEHDRAALTRAVLEGVAFALRDNQEALKAAGARIERITAVGGGARSHYWLRAIATLTNLPIDVPASGEFGAALGAARLGMLAVDGAAPAAACTPPPVAETIEPAAALRGAFEDAYQRYRSLYPRLSAMV